MSNTEDRLATLEHRLRLTRLAVGVLVGVLAVASLVAAGPALVSLVCNELTVKDANGKPVIELRGNGDVELAGDLKVNGHNVGQALKSQKANRLEIGSLHLHSGPDGLPNWRVTYNNPHKQRIRFAKPFDAPPKVLLSVSRFAIIPAPGTELSALVTEVTKEDFKVEISVWSLIAEVREVKMDWLATMSD
jgi:hypothetical protein